MIRKKSLSKKQTNKNFEEVFINFISELQILKNVKRTGWLWRGITNCESIADHCFRVNIISMFLCDLINLNTKDETKKLNVEKVLKMSTIHEICECRVGDIPYPALKYIGENIKSNAEANAVYDMMLKLNFLNGINYYNLWCEFEEGKTNEAKVVKAADKIEMLLQALEYEKNGVTTLEDFWNNKDTFNQIGFHKITRKILKYLIKLHNNLKR